MKFFHKNIVLRIFGLLLLVFAFNPTRGAESVENLAAKANKAYTEGQFYYAIDLYDSILKEGSASAALYYNLGNAYFKTNQLPFAILYYEKARKISPTDDNINFNLNLANSLITDKIEAIPQLFYESWWQALYSIFSADSWAKIAVFSAFLIFICLSIYLISNALFLKKMTFSLTLFFFVITIFNFIFAQKQFNLSFKNQTGIVFSSRITAKSSPDENSIDLFVIHDGTKVNIKDNIGDWSEIKLANGNIGWIKRSLIKLI